MTKLFPLALIALLLACEPPEHFDVVIRGGAVIDASGLTVAPGFIDMHSHSDRTLLVDGRALSKVMQGVTTELVGESASAAPVFGDRGEDTESIRDLSTFEEPHQLAEGVRYLLVNGEVVVADGRHTGATPGRVIRRR